MALARDHAESSDDESSRWERTEITIKDWLPKGKVKDAKFWVLRKPVEKDEMQVMIRWSFEDAELPENINPLFDMEPELDSPMWFQIKKSPAAEKMLHQLETQLTRLKPIKESVQFFRLCWYFFYEMYQGIYQVKFIEPDELPPVPRMTLMDSLHEETKEKEYQIRQMVSGSLYGNNVCAFPCSITTVTIFRSLDEIEQIVCTLLIRKEDLKYLLIETKIPLTRERIIIESEEFQTITLRLTRPDNSEWFGFLHRLLLSQDHELLKLFPCQFPAIVRERVLVLLLQREQMINPEQRRWNLLH